MSKKRGFLVLSIMIILILVFLKTAEGRFEYHNSSIQKDYTAGEKIKGNFNVSFTNHPANSKLTSNFIGEIELIEILRKSLLVEGADYNCTIKKCLADFYAKNEISSSLSLGINEIKTIGLNISGEEASIQSLKIKIKSDAPAFCSEQIRINVLRNSSYALGNTRYLNEMCRLRYQGCFNDDAANEIAELTSSINNPYCGKITLPAAPAYRIGAKLYNSTKEYAEVNAEMYSLDWTLLGKCILPKHKEHFEELNCLVELPQIKQQDYLICVYAKSGVESNYTIPTEQQSPVCGNSERGSEEYTRDYFIFAEALKYDSVNMELNEITFNKFTGENLLTTLNSYLEEKYGNNCKNGCVIPLDLASGLSQTASFEIIEMKYSTKGTIIANNKLYSLEARNSTINSGPVIIELEHANFTIPRNTKDKHFSLFLDGERVYLPINISIGTSFDFDITPKALAIGFPTLFKVVISENVTSVNWNFGDGTIKTSYGKNITHTYKEQKTFNIEVIVTRSKDGVSSTKKFNVVVANAKESAKKLLEESEKSIVKLKSQISKYPGWISKEIEKRVNVTELEKKILELNETNKLAKTDEEYVEIINNILDSNIPDSISVSIKGSEPLITGLAGADLNYIEKISGKQAGNREMLKKELLAWIENNYNLTIEREVISSHFGSNSLPIITRFAIVINKKNKSAEQGNLIIAIPKNYITFDKNYGEKEIRGDSGEATWITINKSDTISFVVPEEISLSAVGAYFSPDISSLVQEISVKPQIEKPNRSKWAILWISILIVVFLIVYVSLQEWYKRRYESYLFKNKDDLYNIINFIFNARNSSMSDAEIKKKLGTSGWGGEQITYAFKKIDGKRTGMWEIPIFKFLENRKVKEEIEKRQGRPVDIRFIKRPTL